MFRTYVVTTRNSLRSEFVLRQLAQYRSVLDGPYNCYGEDYESLVSQPFGAAAFKARYARTPTSAEIGAALGHRVAYISLVESRERFAIVLEDDVKFDVDPRKLESLESWCKDNHFDVLILGYSKFDQVYQKHFDLVNPIVKVATFPPDGAICCRFRESTYGSLGYVISRSAAERLINNTNPDYLSDDWTLISRDVEVLHVSPSLIWEDYLRIPSMSGHDNAPLRPVEYKSLLLNVLLYISRKFKHYYRLTLLWIRVAVLK